MIDLEHLDDPAALTGSPLLALPTIATVEDLRIRPTGAIHALADPGTPCRPRPARS
jgi:hypothetical protein